MNSYLFRVCYVKELKSYFSSPLVYIFLVFFLVLIGVFCFTIGRFFERGEASLESSFFIWFPWLLAFLIPSLCMNSWSSEYKSNTLETLLSRPVPLGCFILAKFFSALTVLTIALLLTASAVVSTIYLGDPDLTKILSGYIGCLFLGSSYIALSLMASSLTKSPVISFVLATIFCIALVLAGLDVLGNETQKVLAEYARLIEIFTSIGVLQYFGGFSKGLIEFRAIIYFSGLTAAALLANYFILKDARN